MKSETRPTPAITVLLCVGAPVGILGLVALLLWLSDNWRWVEGWIFGVWWVSFIAAMFLWLRFKDPALLAERLRLPGTGGLSGNQQQRRGRDSEPPDSKRLNFSNSTVNYGTS